jgi:membrane-associated phospholipid phosphatase
MAVNPTMQKLKDIVRKVSLWIFLLGFSCTSLADLEKLPGSPSDYGQGWAQNFAQDIRRDFTVYFENDNLIVLGDTFLVAGLLANTGLDRAFAQHWQTDIRTHATDNFFDFPKAIGGLSYYYAPIYLATMGIGHLREHSLFGNVLYHWGYRSIRTFILGGLQQVILTNALGSGRPCNHQDSKWQPFRYETAVSGHAFYGAIPFLTAAMMTEQPILKATLYTLSVLPGVSRINSNRHYLSQVILGWGIAFLSARSVYQSDQERKPDWQINVYPRTGGAMLHGRYEF